MLDISAIRLPRHVGGAMIALLALGPGAHAEMDMFAAYYNNVARAAAANDAATVARLVAGDGYKANTVDDSGRTGLQIAAGERQPANRGDPDQGRRQREPEGPARQYRAACRDRAQPDRDGRAVDRCRRRSQQREQERHDAADDRGSRRAMRVLVKAMLAKGANVRKTDFTGRDAVSWAQESRRPAVVQALQRAVATR